MLTPMANRASVNIEGLEEDIEAAYSHNRLWARISLAEKLRILIEERLEQLKTERENGLGNQPEER